LETLEDNIKIIGFSKSTANKSKSTLKNIYFQPSHIMYYYHHCNYHLHKYNINNIHFSQVIIVLCQKSRFSIDPPALTNNRYDSIINHDRQIVFPSFRLERGNRIDVRLCFYPTAFRAVIIQRCLSFDLGKIYISDYGDIFSRLFSAGSGFVVSLYGKTIWRENRLQDVS